MATPVDPAAVATDLATNVGGTVVSTAVDVWPALVPALLGMAVISAVVRKFGLGRSRKVL
jgi:hypothetical protein